MKPVRFSRAARHEALEARKYYERQQAGLGQRFTDAVETTSLRVRRAPELCRMVFRKWRKCRVARFPYGLIFREHSDFIEIIAVMHLHRAPGYWVGRSNRPSKQ